MATQGGDTQVESSPGCTGSLLTEISFENFCRFKKATIHLDRWSTSLLGENGKGKTTVLRGIELFSKLFDELSGVDEERNFFEYWSDAFARTFLGGITDWSLIWHNRETANPIKLTGEISSSSVEFVIVDLEKTEGKSSVRITCNRKGSVLAQIGCPSVVSISNTGVFRTPDNQISEVDAQSGPVHRIHVDNISDVSSRLLHVDHIRKLSEDMAQAKRDLDFKTRSYKRDMGDFLHEITHPTENMDKGECKNLKTLHEEVERDTANVKSLDSWHSVIEDKMKGYTAEHGFERYKSILQAQRAILVENERLKRKQVEMELITEGRGLQISRLIEQYEIREGCKVSFMWRNDDVHIAVEEQNVTLPLSQCDAGLQQVVIIMLMVINVQKIEGKKSMHLLLDEPVSLFHGGLVRKLLAYLKEEKFCVTLACHAVDTLMACSSIVSFNDDDGPRNIDMNVLSELKKLSKEKDHTSRLMDLGKTLQTKNIFVVEGETDAKVLAAWIKKVYPGVEIGEKYEVFCHRGRPNKDYVEKLLRFLNSLFQLERETVRIFFLVDRDCRAKRELKLEEKSVHKEAEVYGQKFQLKWYCYERREQENYFLCAAALKSCLKTVTEEKLKKSIEKHFQIVPLMEEYLKSVKRAKSQSEGKKKEDSAMRSQSEGKKKEDSAMRSQSEGKKEDDSAMMSISEDDRILKEIKDWKEDKRSFTDAKKVLKDLGIPANPQSYAKVINGFQEEDIPPEIKILVEIFLNFFNIQRASVNRTPATTPVKEATESTSFQHVAKMSKDQKDLRQKQLNRDTVTRTLHDKVKALAAERRKLQNNQRKRHEGSDGNLELEDSFLNQMQIHRLHSSDAATN